ncbi:MAG: aminopeptidase P family protein [Clostridia bacterium]|nr:aminopeptidase P family protein [Clostridia bacterium]MCI9274791.1 aminopeptidase P family protein [Clostridia bacterium]
MHENPVISSKSEKVLKENMVVAIEPRYIYSR